MQPSTALKSLHRLLLPSCWMEFLGLALIPSCLPALIPVSSQACCTLAFGFSSSLGAQQLLSGSFVPKKGHIQETPPTHHSRESLECQILPHSLFLDPPSPKNHTGIAIGRDSGWPSALTKQRELRAQGLRLG